jgi:hypothetical protein
MKSALEATLESQIAVEEGRIHDAVEKLFAAHCRHLRDGAARIAPEFPTLQALPSIDRVQRGFKPQFALTAGFAVTSQSRTKQVGIKTEYVWESEDVGFWDALWHTVSTFSTTREKPVYAMRQFDTAAIPNLKDVVEGFVIQAANNLGPLVTQFGEWFGDEVERLTAAAGLYEESVIGDYQTRLDEARSRAATNYERKHAEWSAMEKAAREIVEELASVVCES